MKRYVQSKYSTNAPKWEVYESENQSKHEWAVHNKQISEIFLHFLPKSEYHEVPAPEQWERCGSNVFRITDDPGRLKIEEWRVYLPTGFRWAWARQEDGTLVIERRVEP